MASAALDSLDYYAVLQIKHSADYAAIKDSFSRLAAQYDLDPDRPPESDQAEQARRDHVELLARAYVTLSDPKKRREYDQVLRAASKTARDAPSSRRSRTQRAHRHGELAPPKYSAAVVKDGLERLEEEEAEHRQLLRSCLEQSDSERAKIIAIQDAQEENARDSALAAAYEEGVPKDWPPQSIEREKKLAREQRLRLEKKGLELYNKLKKHEEQLVQLEGTAAILEADLEEARKDRAKFKKLLKSAEEWEDEQGRQDKKRVDAVWDAEQARIAAIEETDGHRQPNKEPSSQNSKEPPDGAPQREPRPVWFDDKNWRSWQDTGKSLVYWPEEFDEAEAEAKEKKDRREKEQAEKDKKEGGPQSASHNHERSAPRSAGHDSVRRTRDTRRSHATSSYKRHDDDGHDEDIYNYSG